jgi:hypothetical protein
MSTQDRLEQAGLLYERAVFGGDVSALPAADRELDAVEAGLCLARGRIVHARFLEKAVVRGCHVFLTRDRKILQRRADLALVGIVPMRPTHLLDALSDSRETEQPLGADGMMCDNHKWMHLKAATREDETAV